MRRISVAVALAGLAMGALAVAGYQQEDKLVKAIIQVESAGDDGAVGDGGKSVGCLQITEQMVDDVNRISGLGYQYTDRTDRQKSIQMYCIYTNHYSNNESDEVKARRWNGGPNGDRKQATVEYWRKVKSHLE